ncbi:MAG: transcription antitermination factor NusB [Bacteroidaceae bacterium]
MINRAIIRSKVIQLVYAYHSNGHRNLNSAEKELLFSLSKAYDLYQFLLVLMIEITEKEVALIDWGKSKRSPSAEELSPNMKFVNNLFIAQLQSNKQLVAYRENEKRSWKNDSSILKTLTEEIKESSVYKQYMSDSEQTFEGDRDFWRKIYKSLFYHNEVIDDILEDMSLYWNDDKEIVDTFVFKTIKRLKQEEGENAELLPEFSNPTDRDYAIKLFHKTLLNIDYYSDLIKEQVRNWDFDRIASMDIAIMQTAVAEMISFGDIPLCVTLNEYVELAKIFSTPRSASFVNGTLDKIAQRLVDERKILKIK